ncbi:MAG TPA: Rieske 2Fe-2S domain-containing protein, partial [Steroidobacteraceae bacterium]|nr:Rieske 2Fe-2S domain-containing protein [Steroidobacteraceae bacterium]
EPLGQYFKFLKEAGRHLDPKTRDLISVITKVHARTERGLRQYLLRALRDGCSANEVLDALLMAFPALGLTRITWAIDVILAMDLPEFRPEALGAGSGWHELAAVDSIPVGAVERIQAGGRACFVHHAPDGFMVYDSRCPHEVTDIPQLACSGKRLTCPKHGWVFDLATGACIDKGDRPLTRRQTKIQDGRLLAFW